MKKVIAAVMTVVMLLSGFAGAAGDDMADLNAGSNVMSGLSDMQRNSIGVLNYLSYLTKDIESRKSQRMYLEEAYSALYNNTYMNAIDEVTLGQVKSLLTALFNFRMVAVKRERIEYIYEQEQARAIYNAIPNPLNLLNIVQSDRWPKHFVSVINLAVDSAVSYEKGKYDAELSYLQDGWELDDEEARIIHDGHLDSIDYMWEIIHDYDLPAELALNEDDIDRFVMWKSNPNLAARIQFLESNREVYQGFGEYWLTLAESYYEHGDMGSCLEAVWSYEQYGTRIFRKDYHYAKVLPMAITAAAATYGNAEYIVEAERCADRIVRNSEQDDWLLRLFAAETYIDLAGRSGENGYLEKAYDIVMNNVNWLTQEQIGKNDEYLSDIRLEIPAAGASEARKKETEQYNSCLKAARKIALPPVNDALVLNCDLLFLLADALDIDEAERERIDSILYGHTGALFLCTAMDRIYRPDSDTAPEDCSRAAFDGSGFSVPAGMVTENAVIRACAVDMATGNIITIDDWRIQSVDRETVSDIGTFTAVYASETARDMKWSEGSTIWFELDPSGDGHTETVRILFNAVSKTDFLFPHLVFERVDG